MQQRKQLKFSRDKDPLLTFLGILFVSGTIMLITLLVYYMSA